MSRSRVLVVSLAVALAALCARPAPAQQSSLLDAIGTVDYSHGRSFIHVGQWARYHLTARSDMGVSDDYTVTVLIAGEEDWWGEECFWVETWTQHPRGAVVPAATLMSYAIFDDSLSTRHLQLYQRKRIEETDESGRPVQQLVRRGMTAMKSRTPIDPGLTRKTDTLGTDTARTAKGEFPCLKVRVEVGIGSTAQSADSSQYTEVRDVRVKYLTPQVPVTGIAREEIDYGVRRRTWLTGRSQESTPLRVMDQSKGAVELVDFGTGGLKPMLVPENVRSTLAEQRAASAHPAATARKAAAPAKAGAAKATPPKAPGTKALPKR